MTNFKKVIHFWKNDCQSCLWRSALMVEVAMTHGAMVRRFLFAEILANAFPAGFRIYFPHALHTFTCPLFALVSHEFVITLLDERGAEQELCV